MKKIFFSKRDNFLSNRTITILLGTSFMLFSAGCSEQSLSFTDASEALVKTCLDAACSEAHIDENYELDFNRAPNDVLFVVDDSSSMSSILSNIKSGFASLQSAHFPTNTKMATTYMSPDIYNSDGSIQFGTPWHSLAGATPGHLRLTNAASVNYFLSLNQTPEDAKNFVHKACENEWFSPDELNSDGIRCLDAAVQTPLYGVGVEAGVVSLEQMIIKYSQAGQRLFRDGSFVNIIFVSDTHEPGADYWGRKHARANQASLSEILNLITQNNPTVRSIKFSGVLPVPKVGTPILEDLKVVGATPLNDEEAHVNGENNDGQFWDYSYIPFIKGTDGVISHPKGNDWSDMAESLMDDANYTGTIVVKVAYKIKQLDYLKVNNEWIDSSLVTISEDGMSLNVRYTSRSDAKVKINISYTSESI